MYGYASCGHPVEISDQTDDWRFWPEEIVRGVNGTLIVRGNSMQAIGFQDGDILFVRALDGAKPQPGRKVIVNILGDGCMCKIYREDEKFGPYLESAPGDGDPSIVHLTPGMSIVAQVVRRLGGEE